MAKKTINAQQSTRRRQKSPAPKPRIENRRTEQSGVWWSRAFGVRSMAVGLAGAVLLYMGLSMNEGYKWVWTGLLKSNWKVIRTHKNATIEERYAMKVGFDYSYLNYIKKNTPEDAIILFPPHEHLSKTVDNQKLSNQIGSKKWVTHFLYPRRVLYQTEKDKNPLYNQVTHVAITAGYGYEYLEYTVNEQPPFAVFPKRKTNP
ncbi:MAG: hypothetical protein LBD59_04355 [Prevotellaceae bacterium]|jgi:hypothetical protein|nr:hypothetical protein [Prevotellaceae bacterium]